MERIATSDNLDVAAYLALRGLALLRVDTTTSPRSTFVFADPEGRADILTAEYWRSEIARFVSYRMELRHHFKTRHPRRQETPA